MEQNEYRIPRHVTLPQKLLHVNVAKNHLIRRYSSKKREIRQKPKGINLRVKRVSATAKVRTTYSVIKVRLT